LLSFLATAIRTLGQLAFTAATTGYILIIIQLEDCSLRSLRGLAGARVREGSSP